MDEQLVRVNRKRDRLEEEDGEEMDIIMLLLCTLIIGLYRLYDFDRIPVEPSVDYDHERHTYLKYIRSSDIECIEQLRVSRQCFLNLCQVLKEKGKLTRTKHVPIEETVAMFLHILGHNLKYRIIHGLYFRSKETISRQFNKVLQAVMRISKDYLKLYACVLSDADKGKWTWFENCLGALDGTHIPVTIPVEVQPKYRNRKGYISTNMLGVCSPNLKFTYVLPGWEGSASDSRVLRDALQRRHRLHVPKDKYYLVDAGYTNGPGFLAPYRGTRYHLNEWKGNRPRNHKELFNLRHAKARNSIERSFGVLKKRWSILRTASFFDITTQIRIINACCVLHNFIQIEQTHDQILEAQFLEYLDEVDLEIAGQLVLQESLNVEDEITCVQVTQEWTTFRDNLAKNMFDGYVSRA